MTQDANEIFKGKVVLVTGSARGIGAAAAKIAHQRGATVILHGKTESEQLKKLASQLDDAQIVYFDVANKSEVDTHLKPVLEQLGKVDVLINSAGISRPVPFLESDDNNWHEQFDVNVLGIVHVCQAVIPYMQKNKYGRIVNVSSTRGHAQLTSNRGMAYSATKAAVINVTAALAKEFAPDISVNAVSPSFTNTDIQQTWNDGVWKQVETALLPRVAEPSEIAEAIIFLASDLASFITGQTLLVDGGYTMSGK